MNRRFRGLAALLALFALSAYTGESVWAAWCPPGASHTAVAADAGVSGAHLGMHHDEAPASEEHGSTRSEAPGCPLGMAGSGSTCVAAPLPGAVTSVSDPIVASSGIQPPSDSTRDRLLVVPHFRPPRA